jgi:hypothetical protein
MESATTIIHADRSQGADNQRHSSSGDIAYRRRCRHATKELCKRIVENAPFAVIGLAPGTKAVAQEGLFPLRNGGMPS